MRVVKPIQLDFDDSRPLWILSSANALKRAFKFTVASLLGFFALTVCANSCLSARVRA